MNTHPINPATPRGGFLATVELNTGTKRTRHFEDSDEARRWVDEQVYKAGKARGNVVPVV